MTSSTPDHLDGGSDGAAEPWALLAELHRRMRIPSGRSTLPGHRSDGTGSAVDALDELLATIVEYGCACVIVSAMGRPSTFVQCIATPVGFRLEAVSNVFLWATPERLDVRQEQLLGSLGWHDPDVPADPADRPDDWAEDRDSSVNWWTDVEGVEATHAIADLLLRTLVLVYPHPGEVPFEVEVFPSEHQLWVWEDGALFADD